MQRTKKLRRPSDHFKFSKQVYFSIDVEATGPCPYKNDMISVGIAVYQGGNLIDTLKVNLLPKDGGDYTFDEGTKKWWDSQPKEIWEAATVGAVPFIEGLKQIKEFCINSKWGSDAVMVYAPSLFDGFMIRGSFASVGLNFPFSGYDFRSFVSGLLGKPLRRSSKKDIPWKSDVEHNHDALQDAIEQGLIFTQAVAYRERLNEFMAFLQD